MSLDDLDVTVELMSHLFVQPNKGMHSLIIDTHIIDVLKSFQFVRRFSSIFEIFGEQQ